MQYTWRASIYHHVDGFGQEIPPRANGIVISWQSGSLDAARKFPMARK